MKTVFCDESGSTGNNLWQADQPHFVYSAVAIENDAATDLLERVRRDFRIQSPEFHTAQLLRRENGERAVRAVLSNIGDAASVAVFHKRYSLAGKMFEYLIEPIISDRSTAFYNIGFQRFVATGLFLSQMVNEPGAAQAFQAFQDLMRTGDEAHLHTLIDAMLVGEERRFLHQIATIVLCNIEPVREELAGIRGNDAVAAWMLELTNTALMSLLSSMSGPEMTPLVVTCDDSKPLLRQLEMFDVMIGRQDYRAVEFDGRNNQITFNLARRIELGDSRLSPGIQIADVVASAAAYALKNEETPFAQFWRSNCRATLHPNSVVPEIEEFDLSTRRGLVNAFILDEFERRSVMSQSLIANVREMLELAHAAADEYANREENEEFETPAP